MGIVTGFTGVPVIKSLGTNVVRVTGLTLGVGIIPGGKIQLAGGPEVSGPGNVVVDLPADFPSEADAGALAIGVSFLDLVEVRYTLGGGDATLNITKTDSPFLVLVENVGTDSATDIEFYFQYHHSAHR
jgi:hypothetical protein